MVGFSTRDSTRPTSTAASLSPARLFWRTLQHCCPCDCEGSAPTHPHTHPPARARTHARSHARTPHAPFFFPLSLSSLSVGAGAEAAGASEAQTAPRMLGRGRRSRCGYPSPTSVSYLRLLPASTRSSSKPLLLTAGGERGRRQPYELRRGVL